MYHPANSSFLSHEDQNFNPKAASQASWTTRPTRPKPTGPLVESEQFKRFNRHPDSYVSAPYGNINSKTMSRHTKPIVKWTRLLQLLLRICALLGALGMLVCVICIKGTEPTTGWIIRVPVSYLMACTNVCADIYGYSQQLPSFIPSMPCTILQGPLKAAHLAPLLAT